MEFKLLHNDTECNCIDNAKQDLTSLYARKIGKPSLRDKDLETHWERGKRPDLDDCKSICGFKGMSVNIWDKSSKDSITNKFLTTFSITPSRKDCIYLFKFKENAGLLKHTPNRKDLFHYDFYKCDEFSKEMVEEIEIISLREILNGKMTK